MTGSRSLTPKSLFRIRSSMPDETKTIARQRKIGLRSRFNRHRTHDRLHTAHQLVFQNTPCVQAVERVIRKRRVACERRVGMLRLGVAVRWVSRSEIWMTRTSRSAASFAHSSRWLGIRCCHASRSKRSAIAASAHFARRMRRREARERPEGCLA